MAGQPASPSSAAAPRRVSATTLAQYVRFGNCDRLLYFSLYPKLARELAGRWHVSDQPLTPLLRAEGEQFEQQVVSQVVGAGQTIVDLAGHRNSAVTVAQLRTVATAGQAVVLAQAPLAGQIGDWPCGGSADLIWLTPRATPAGTLVDVTIADVKSSLAERVEHRLQVAFYVRLLRQMAAAGGIELGEVAGAVLHRDGDTGEPAAADPADAAPFDLAAYNLALDHLLGDPDSVLSRVGTQTFEEVPYSLSFKCDGCLFNGHCMHDSAGRDSLALVPHIVPGTQRLLEREGLRTFRDLASLTTPAAPDQYHGPLAAAPGREDQLARLRAHWQLAGLDRLSQRARALVRSRDGVRGGSFEPAIDAGFGTLPADDFHPGLVKVFFDAQHDYVQDAVYVACALIKGPNGERTVVARTAAPADRAAEADLLRDWVARVYTAILEVAAGPEAFLHFYTYSRHDQSVLLAALRRHLGAIPALASLFDLLTASAALAPVDPLAQPMISFLAEEVRDRMTLDVTCTSLHEVATRLGFSWTGPTPAGASVVYRERFRARVFDSRRLVDLAYANGHAGAAAIQAAAAAGVPSDAGEVGVAGEATGPDRDRGTWIEGAARFRSQIPLEYAYGAWAVLPAPQDALQQRLLQPYQDITWDELEGFAVHRLRALTHIESRFRFKSRYTDKRAVPLLTIAAAALTPASLPRALQDFLFVEHYARIQELLLSYAQPIELRAQSGRAMLVECLAYQDLGDGNASARCRLALADLGLDPLIAGQALRLKEGDWVVVNPAGGGLSPAAMLHGRLATITALTADSSGALTVDLALNGLTAKRVFSYWHRNRDAMAPGDFYTVDEMGDDLNGDKFLAACRAAADPQLQPNPLLAWVAQADAATAAAYVDATSSSDAATTTPGPSADAGTPTVRITRPVATTLAAHAAACLATVTEVERAAGGEGPTARQADAIAGHLDDALFLIQGPPGTGKSHTLGWAILVRLAAARLAGARSFRAAVSSKTHNAIAIVLNSVASKLALLRRHAPAAPFTRALAGLRVCKLETDAPATVDGDAPAVERLSLYARRADLEPLLTAAWTVVGATPGGLYNAGRYRTTGGKDVPWDDRPFDLVVLDESSQVNLPEAVLASAFLRADGQALVVGDHRQMAPIVAVQWNEESRRTVVDGEVYHSVFEFLRARGFPWVGLDRSFRLHHRLAAFLEEIVYRQDGIPFYSDRDALLPPAATGDPFVDAVLSPDYPVVVVEHADATSQQSSAVELELLAPLLDACTGPLGLDGTTGVGVVVPHRAQRALLRARFPALAEAGALDTVERFQGGEREVIAVSATVSDPDYILGEADFLFNPNRLNVALSRPRRKLIVLASAGIFHLLASDPDLFERAALWKRLRYSLTTAPLWQGERAGTSIRVFGCPA